MTEEMSNERALADKANAQMGEMQSEIEDLRRQLLLAKQLLIESEEQKVGDCHN